MNIENQSVKKYFQEIRKKVQKKFVSIKKCCNFALGKLIKKSGFPNKNSFLLSSVG